MKGELWLTGLRGLVVDGEKLQKSAVGEREIPAAGADGDLGLMHM